MIRLVYGYTSVSSICPNAMDCKYVRKWCASARRKDPSQSRNRDRPHHDQIRILDPLAIASCMNSQPRNTKRAIKAFMMTFRVRLWCLVYAVT
jgi:hypothetical protein